MPKLRNLIAGLAVGAALTGGAVLGTTTVAAPAGATTVTGDWGWGWERCVWRNCARSCGWSSQWMCNTSSRKRCGQGCSHWRGHHKKRHLPRDGVFVSLRNSDVIVDIDND